MSPPAFSGRNHWPTHVRSERSMRCCYAARTSQRDVPTWNAEVLPMMPAAKHFDPVLGIDIHIIQPPGPVPPVPIPHPFVGFIIDPIDYAPILGATVMVNGLPRAQAGS